MLGIWMLNGETIKTNGRFIMKNGIVSNALTRCAALFHKSAVLSGKITGVFFNRKGVAIGILCIVLCSFSGCADVLEALLDDSAADTEDEAGTDGETTVIGDFITKGTLELTRLPVALTVSAYYDFSYAPSICYSANSDSSVDIAWYSESDSVITVTSIDESGEVIDEFVPSNIEKPAALAGFTRIASDDSFVFAYTGKYSSTYDELWVTRVDKEGNEKFNNLIFGNQVGTVDADIMPLYYSTSRLAYNAGTDDYCLYLGHGRLWDDGITHQGGYVAFYTPDGNAISRTTSSGTYNVGSTWWVSHNFDQRLLVDGDKYVMLALGDAYPRAVVFAIWNTDTSGSTDNNEVYTEIFDISGDIGDNDTHTRLGGVVKLSDGNYGVVLSSTEGRTCFDVCYLKISPAGTVLQKKWLTQLSSPNETVLPRIVLHADNVLVAWQELGSSTYPEDIHFIELDNDGNIRREEFIVEDVMLPQYDLINLPNGDVFWVTDNGYYNKELIVYWIK